MVPPQDVYYILVYLHNRSSLSYIVATLAFSTIGQRNVSFSHFDDETRPILSELLSAFTLNDLRARSLSNLGDTTEECSYLFTYVLGSSSIWTCRNSNICYCFPQAGAVETIKTIIQNSTRPNR